MEPKFHLFHLYNKKVLSHGAFRVFRLLLDIQNEQARPSLIKASRRLLAGFTGLSENSLKHALDELIELRIVILKSERPCLWVVNSPDKFNIEALNKRIAGQDDSADSQIETAISEDK